MNSINSLFRFLLRVLRIEIEAPKKLQKFHLRSVSTLPCQGQLCRPSTRRELLTSPLPTIQSESAQDLGLLLAIPYSVPIECSNLWASHLMRLTHIPSWIINIYAYKVCISLWLWLSYQPDGNSFIKTLFIVVLHLAHSGPSRKNSPRLLSLNLACSFHASGTRCRGYWLSCWKTSLPSCASPTQRMDTSGPRYSLYRGPSFLWRALWSKCRLEICLSHLSTLAPSS